MIDKVLYLQKKEWWIVIIKMGFEENIGFEALKYDEISDHEVAEAFISLTARGLIEGDNGSFKMSDSFMPYISALRKAKYIAAERRKLDSYPVSCVYIGDDEVLRVELDGGEAERVALRLYSTDSFVDEETGYEFMPVRDSEIPEDYEDYAADLKGWEDSFRDDSSLLLYYRLYDLNKNDVYSDIFVKRESLCDIIVIGYPEGEQTVLGYTKGTLSDILRGNLLEGPGR